MKTNNSSFDMSGIGEVITIETAVGQLADNNVTILADQNSDLAKKAAEVMEQLSESLTEDALYNHYELDIIDDLELASHPTLKNYISEHGTNLLIQLSTPDRDDKQILCVTTNEDSLLEDISLAIYSADNLSYESLANAVSPDNTDQEDIRDYYPDTSIIDIETADVEIPGMEFGMVSGVTGMSGRRGIYGREQNSREHFLELLSQYRHHPSAALLNEIAVVVKSVDPKYIGAFLSTCNPNDQIRFSRLLPENLAKSSSMEIEIRYDGKIDLENKADGFYRVYFNKNGKSEFVHFHRRSSCALYMMFLLDRKEREDKVDTLNLVEYKDKFASVYDLLYGAGGKDEFQKIMSRVNAKGEFKQKDLSVIVSDIRKDVGKICEKLDEIPSPFVLKNLSGHLAALPEKIKVSERLIDKLENS